MNLRGFTDIGADIGRRVTDSINSGDFNQMNRDIRRIIEDAFTNPVNNSAGNVLDGRLCREQEQKDKGFDRVYEAPRNQEYEQQEDNTGTDWAVWGQPRRSNAPKKGGAIAMMIIGYFIAGIFGITGIGLALMIIPAYSYDPTAIPIFGASAAFMVPFLAGGLVLGIAGSKKFGFARRFVKYSSELQNSSFCQISHLAKRVGRKEKFVVNELKKMIARGYFPEGHIDDHETCFIADNATYQQYVTARDSAEKTKSEPEKTGGQMPADMEQVIGEGEAYIKAIQDANDAIYDPVISEKLFRMEIIVKKIFDYVRENPDQVSQLRRFMNYYMPTTEKLVKAYQKMDEETVLGQNMNRAKDEIAETLDTINEAYEKLYDSMHIDIAMDVSSDISVLKTMFAQEGLSKDELGGKKDE